MVRFSCTFCVFLGFWCQSYSQISVFLCTFPIFCSLLGFSLILALHTSMDHNIPRVIDSLKSAQNLLNYGFLSVLVVHLFLYRFFRICSYSLCISTSLLLCGFKIHIYSLCHSFPATEIDYNFSIFWSISALCHLRVYLSFKLCGLP